MWTSSEVLLVEKDPQSNEWRVHVRRTGPNAAERVFRPVHVIFALGTEVTPYIPDFPGKVLSTLFSFSSCLMAAAAMLQEKFQGEMIHTSKFKNAEENAGKRVLVVGAGTSGHDIAWEHVNHGAGEHTLGRLTLIIHGPDSSLITAEVVSGPNMTPPRTFQATESVPKRPYTNEALHTL